MAQGKFEIDLVYLWVDGNDSGWLARKRTFAGDFREGTETDSRARYESNDELKYSLRSAEMYAPWIRRIFIVTDGQTPAWLDTSNPRIRIVDHREILPPQAVPCYNSSVLNHYIYKIPGLSEHFLSANDDTFFGAPLTPDFFFLPDGSPIVRLKRKRFGKFRWWVKQFLGVGVEHYRTAIHDSALLVEKKTGRFIGAIPHHNIDACRKSDYSDAVENVFRTEIEEASTHHTRTKGDLLRVTFSFYAIAMGMARLRWVDNRESLTISVHDHGFMDSLEEFSPRLFCLNDTQEATCDDRRRVRPFLDALFPTPSAFEKDRAKEDTGIDLVYLWVDGNDPEWLARKLAFTGGFRDDSETDSLARYESNDELKYSLRSAEKYAPWIRKIFIVTDGQTPAWLDTSKPRVQIVDHNDILPPEALPCYNSAVIEYFLYRIPGLAEHFLYANDDTFFGAPLTPDYFFDPREGYPIVRLKRKVFGKLRFIVKKALKFGIGYYRRSIFRAASEVERVTGRYFSAVPHHNIDSYLKSDNRRVAENILPDRIAAMLPHHVRAEGDLQRVALSFWALAVGRAYAEYATRRNGSVRIGVHKSDYMGVIRRTSPRLFCLNDSQRASDDDRRRVPLFLEALFPDKSTFELSVEDAISPAGAGESAADRRRKSEGR